MNQAKLHHTRSKDVFTFVAGSILEILKNRHFRTPIVSSSGRCLLRVFRELERLAKAAKQESALTHVELFCTEVSLTTRGDAADGWGFFFENYFRSAIAEGIYRADQLHLFRPTADRAADLLRYQQELEASASGQYLVLLEVGKMGSLFTIGDADLLDLAPVESAPFWTSNAAFISTCFGESLETVTVTAQFLRKAGTGFGMLVGNEKGELYRNYRAPGPLQKAPIKLLNDIPSAFLVTDVYSR